MHFENCARKNGLFRDVPDELWNDWHWQVKNRVETLEDLKKYMNLTEEEEEGVRRTLGRLRMAITPYYLSLIDLNDKYDPIRRQAIPTAHELESAPYEAADPLLLLLGQVQVFLQVLQGLHPVPDLPVPVVPLLIRNIPEQPVPPGVILKMHIQTPYAKFYTYFSSNKARSFGFSRSTFRVISAWSLV